MRNPTHATQYPFTAEVAADAAEAFVRDHLDPAIAEARDGGLALMHALVDRIFFDAAYHDEAGDMDMARECLEVARQAIDRGRAA